MDTKTKDKIKNRTIQTISWVIVIGIILYVLASIAPKEQTEGFTFWQKIGFSFELLGNALSQANIPALLLLLFSYLIYLLFWESTGTRWVINRFNCAISFWEILPARAVTFLLAAFNYQAGQLAIPLYLKRMHKVPLQEGMGSIFYIAAVDLCSVFIMGTVGALFIQGQDFSKEILFFGCLGILGFITNAVFWRWQTFNRLIMKVFDKLPILNRMNQERSIFYTFQKAKLKDYLITFALRAPLHCGIILGLYLSLICFGEKVPLLVVLIYLPIVMIVSTIPLINVGGVGANQALVVYFFKAYAPEATIFAVALTWACGLNILKVILGGIFLNKHSTELFRKEDPTTPAAA